MQLNSKASVIRYLFLIIFTLFSSYSIAKPKIIIDADLHHYADDHEALVMLAQLHVRENLDILGVTLLSGNHWLGQNEIDTLKALERINMHDDIPVFSGAKHPLLHSQRAFEQDKVLYGSIYAGAWDREDITETPIDGAPQTAKIEDEHAIDFIIRSVRENPGEITLVALGPLTNIAIAIRKAPDISKNIKSIIYMGGAVIVPGNVTAAAEFNWWFDAEAATIVLAEPIEHIIIPLDATDKILFNIDLYKEWAEQRHADHFMSKTFFRPKFHKEFSKNENYTIPVWDALVPAYMFDSTVVSKEQEFWIAVDSIPGPNYGRVLAYPANDFNYETRPINSQKAKVILEMNEDHFWNIYEELIFSEFDNN